MELYEFGPTRANRVRWLLKELDLEFDSKLVNLTKGEQFSPEFLEICPTGKIPVLKDGDFSLFESVAICHYLAEKYNDKKLIPQSATLERAKYDQWVLFCVNEIEGQLWIRERHSWIYPENKRSALAVEMATEEFHKAAKILDHEMTNKSYIIDNKFSVADIIIGYTLNWANSRDLLASYTQLTRYLAALKDRPAYPHEMYRQ